MGALIIHDDVLQRVSDKLDKFERLMWFARSHPADSDFWDTVPAAIKEGALNSQAKVQEHYPDEVDELCCPEHGDFAHGFNSGMVAALRYVLSAAEDPEMADELFPELDS